METQTFRGKVLSQAEVVQIVNQIAFCYEAKGENVFKVRAFHNAANVLQAMVPWEAWWEGKDFEIKGIGKGIAAVLTDLWNNGFSQELAHLQADFPEGFFEFVQLKGVGVKKAFKLIETLGVHSIKELKEVLKKEELVSTGLVAKKYHQQLIEAIAVYEKARSHTLLYDALVLEERMVVSFQAQFGDAKIQAVGELGRRCEVIKTMEFVVQCAKELEKSVLSWAALYKNVSLFFAGPQDFEKMVLEKTGPAEFVDFVLQKASGQESLFAKSGLPFIAGHFRDRKEVLTDPGLVKKVLNQDQLRGVFHVHTVYSDGIHTLDDMVGVAVKSGYDYIGISDHSQSAVYAKGLTFERIQQQAKEIEQVRKRFPTICILHGIESDILADGSLDYPQEVLQSLDFVIGSIHTRFQMAKEAMTERILNAMENPFMDFLGHPTGRLLLEREPYAIDMEKIIQKAAQKKIAVEMNVSKHRLDIDWRVGPLMVEYGCLTSLNPDAHAMSEMGNVSLGVLMAQKSLIPADQFVNINSLEWIQQWLRRNRHV
jgi:DNA polymerase (family 10)